MSGYRGPRRSIWPDRPLTGMEVGMVLGIVGMVVLLCVGLVIVGALMPAPEVQPYQPLPTVSSS